MSDPYTDYAAAMDRIVEQLGEIAPGRVVTRTYTDFNDRPRAGLQAGVYTVLFGGVRGYPYEHRPGDMGQVRLSIIFQQRLPEKSDGEALEAAEFAAINELERLAREHDPVRLPELLLEQVATSQQLEAPFVWVASSWNLMTEPT